MSDNRGFLRRPLFLFLLLLAVAVLRSGGDSPFPTLLIRVSLFLLASAFLVRARSCTLSINLVDLLLLGFLLVAGASLAWAGYKWVAYQWFMNYAAVFVAYAAVRMEVREGGDAGERAFWTGVAVLAVLLVAVQAAQRGLLGYSRPSGTMGNPNFASEFLLYGGLAWLAVPMPAFHGTKAERWLRAGAILVVAAGIWMARSRGVLLVGTLLLMFLVWRAFGWRKAAAAGAALLLAVFLLGGGLVDRFRGKADPYAFERLSMWKAAVETVSEHPQGVGPGNYKYYFPQFRDPVEGTTVRYSKTASSPHNEFFSVLSELGIAGGAIFLGLACVAIVSIRRALRDAKHPLGTTASLVVAVSGLHAMVDFNYHVFAILLANAAALGVASTRYWPELLRRVVPVSLPTRAAVLLLLGAAIAYSGMTYAGYQLHFRGERLRAAGKIPDARNAFLAAGAADPLRGVYPDSVAAMDYATYLDTGDPAFLFRAQDAEDTARMLNPVDYRYAMRLGIINAAAADHLPPEARGLMIGGAYHYLEKARRLHPRDANILYLEALLDLGTGNRAQAMKRAGQILEMEPNYARGYFLIGEILGDGDREAAVRAYEKALEIHRAVRGDAALDPFERRYLGLDVAETRRRIDALRRSPVKG